MSLESTFAFKVKDDKQFNFKLFYEDLANQPPEDLRELTKKKLQKVTF